LDVLPDLRNELDLGLYVAAGFAIDLFEVGANRFDQLREIRRRLFHGGSGRTLSWPEQAVEVGGRLTIELVGVLFVDVGERREYSGYARRPVARAALRPRRGKW